MSIIEQIKAKIERLKLGWNEVGQKGVELVLNDLLSFLDTLGEKSEKPEPFFFCKLGGTISKCSDCKRNHGNSKYNIDEIESWYSPSMRGMKQCDDYIPQKSEKPMNQDELENEAVSYCFDNGLNLSPRVATDFARHFYELGCRRTAEKYDEIEYNRQIAEEKQVNEELEEEIERYLPTIPEEPNNEELRVFARHFAQWGAEHIANPGKTSSGSSEIPNDLEEAVVEYSKKASDGHNYRDLRVGFIDGAKWQKEQMMENALHGWLDEDNEPPYDLNVVCEEKIPFGKFKHGDKVHIIIMKED